MSERTLQEQDRRVTELLDALEAHANTALAYDAAIQRYAKHGESWVGGDDLDALYEAWLNAANGARALLRKHGRMP